MGCIANQSLEVSAAGLKLEDADACNCSYQEYGNLMFAGLNQQTTRANSGWEFRIEYRNYQNIQPLYNSLL